MCLAIPGQIVKKINNNTGLVDLGSVTKEVSLVFLPDIEIGDWIIIHTGFALEKISEKDALETIELLHSAYSKGRIE